MILSQLFFTFPFLVYLSPKQDHHKIGFVRHVKRTYHKPNNRLTVSFSNNYVRKASQTDIFFKDWRQGQGIRGDVFLVMRRFL